MSPPLSKMWTEDDTAKLRELWTAKYSGQQIANELGKTRNAVLGKVFRLGLEERGSPQNIADARSRKRAKKLKADPHQREAVARIVPLFDDEPEHVPECTAFKADPEEIAGRRDKCQFPTGDPGRPNFRYCGGQSIKGQPYCKQHMGVAYINKPSRLGRFTWSR